MNVRWFLWATALAVVSILTFVYGQVIVSFDTPSYYRVVFFPLAGGLGVLLTLLALGVKPSSKLVFVLWIPAVLFRCLLLPAAYSDDVNRYLWEGKLLAEGINPYTQTVDDPALASHRDIYWEGINHKDKPTAYPPLILAIFAVLASVAYKPLLFKIAFVLADLLVIGLLVSILRRRGLSPLYAGFYAFNPVILVAYAAEGHFDSLMIMPLVLGLWLYERGRFRAACAVATLGAGIKWMTLPLVPFLSGKRFVSAGIVSVICLCLPFLFFRSGALEVLAALIEFGGTRSFNGPLYDILTIEFGISRSLGNGVVGLIFVSLLLWRWVLRHRSTVDAHFRWILGGLIVLSPTVHFWYIAWILPFVALNPRMPWLLLSFSSGAYFFVWTNVDSGSYWGLQPFQRILFWGPFALSCFYELWSTRGQIFRSKKLLSRNSDATISIIVPTLNIEDCLGNALKSVENQSVAPNEIILVDAGSEDGTREVAERSNLNIEIIESELGRGNQIAKGIEAAKSDWVLILHADAILNDQSLERLKLAVASNPLLVAGALGQRFDGNGWQLSIIEILNEVRALFTRTAFGDQVQFFHRETALREKLMPVQPLMEDVESSWRSRLHGESVYLGCPCSVSRRKWKSKGWFKRVLFVVGLLIRYRRARARGLDEAASFSRQLYQEYYKRPS